MNVRLRKIIKTRGHFPSGDAATKLIWRVLPNIAEDWGRAANNWKSAMNRFAILYETGSRKRPRKILNQRHQIGESSMSLIRGNSDRPTSRF